MPITPQLTERLTREAPRGAATMQPLPPRGVGGDERPVVLIDAAPEPRLRVTAVTRSGPLDEAWAEVEVVGEDAGKDRWRSEVVVAWPRVLSDGSHRWPVVVAGRVERLDVETSNHREGRRLRVVDAWSERLNQAVSPVWVEEAEGALGLRESAVLETGAVGVEGVEANRSSLIHDILGREVFVPRVPQPGGADAVGRWTLGDALEAVLAMAGVDAEMSLIPPASLSPPLTHSLDLGQPLRRVLGTLLTSAGLRVTREVWLVGGRTHQTTTLRPDAASRWRGRPVEPGEPGAGGSLGDVLSLRRSQPTGMPRRLIATATPWEVEATLPLLPDWDAALAGEADDIYDSAVSGDLPKYANIFRRWSLDPAAAASLNPLNDAEPYTKQAGWYRERFEKCLTLDDRGRKREPVVEVSVDGGSEWARWPGEAVVAGDEAGVYLADPQLPASFLAAARVGEARLRVTATLRAQQVVETSRWRGNPFAATLATPLRMSTGSAFGFRRVHPSSVQHAAVRLGHLDADERDDTAPLERWLVERMRGPASPEAEGDVTLPGLHPAVRPGDRLLHASLPTGLRADRIVIDIDADTTRVEARPDGSS